jgi:ATP phosphoribosyltransferase regulatory subunit
MMKQNRWLLPEGIEEILPPQALRMEMLCRRVLDLYRGWGYELVVPPLMEFLESLLTGTGEDLDLQTFKLIDQLSGRLLGIRADTTPQVARIDAHNLKREVPTRLCYLGAVLHARPESSGGTRCPFQVGAELYGHQGVESDAEVLTLMLETLDVAGIEHVHVDIGHVGVYQGITRQAGLTETQESELFTVLQRKASSELKSLIKSWAMPKKTAGMLEYLISANGDASVLKEAKRALAPAGPGVKRCLSDLQNVAGLVQKQRPGTMLYFDLAELRGYHYHTGIVFAAYVPGAGQGIAFGGRYDDIGSAYGRARAATGFSTDIKVLHALSSLPLQEQRGIFAPAKDDPELLKYITQLRRKGEIVIVELPGQKGKAKDMGCDRRLVLKGGKWTVVKL